MTRKLFLSLMIAFTLFNFIYIPYKVDQVNNITDQYLDQLMKNSVLIGCVFPTGDYEYCNQLVNTLDWSKLGEDLKRVSKETGK